MQQRNGTLNAFLLHSQENLNKTAKFYNFLRPVIGEPSSNLAQVKYTMIVSGEVYPAAMDVIFQTRKGFKYHFKRKTTVRTRRQKRTTKVLNSTNTLFNLHPTGSMAFVERINYRIVSRICHLPAMDSADDVHLNPHIPRIA